MSELFSAHSGARRVRENHIILAYEPPQVHSDLSGMLCHGTSEMPRGPAYRRPRRLAIRNLVQALEQSVKKIEQGRYRRLAGNDFTRGIG
jgi:hypothetical protein